METTPRDYSYYNTIMSYYYSNMNNNLMTYSKNIYKIYPEIGITKYKNEVVNEVDLDTDEIFNDTGYDITLYQNTYDNNDTNNRVENYDDRSDTQTEMMDDLDDDLDDAGQKMGVVMKNLSKVLQTKDSFQIGAVIFMILILAGLIALLIWT